MTHSWCRDIPRDEAVRAAEDGRSGPLPTLEEAISRAGQSTPQEARQEPECPERESVTGRRPPEPGVSGNVTGFTEPVKCSPALSESGEGQSGLRTERVTLEVTHRFADPIASVLLQALDSVLSGQGESVFVMDGSCEITKLTDERDAAIRERNEWHKSCHYAIRERDKLRGEITSVLDRSEFASKELTRLRNRVAELESQLESVADRAAAAEMALEAAPAASGAAGTEASGNELPTE